MSSLVCHVKGLPFLLESENFALGAQLPANIPYFMVTLNALRPKSVAGQLTFLFLRNQSTFEKWKESWYGRF